MKNGLQKYFPMIRTRTEVLKEIQSKPNLLRTYQNWKPQQQEYFLDCVTGVKGVKILYDGYFKEIMNPETTPERLESFLSVVLQQNVKIRNILPSDNSRIADESSLLIMDILIELEDGSLANIEVQKIGYNFPGQRCACYSADLLLRQYKRVRGEKGKAFSYKDIKRVYTLVLIESSSSEFHKFPNDHLHWFQQKSNTGLEVELLQEYVLIPLDILRSSLQNKGIKNELDAWLTFLSVDEPEIIEKLIRDYPQFVPLYQQIYEICMNTERVMNLFSEELRILDRNTVQLMIDEMQDEIIQKNQRLSQQEQIISQLEQQISQQEQIISQQGQQFSQQEQIISRQEQIISQQGQQFSQQEQMISQLEQQVSQQEQIISQQGQQFSQQEQMISQQEQMISQLEQQVSQQISQQEQQLRKQDQEIEGLKKLLIGR